MISSLRVQGAITLPVLLVAAGLVLFAFAAMSGYRSLSGTAHETALREMAWRSLLNAERTLTILTDIETGQRGFALTGNPDYLAPFQSGIGAIETKRAKLAASLAQLPGFEHDFAELDGLITRRVALARRNVEALRDEARETHAQHAMFDEGKQAMSLVRERIGDLDRRLFAEIEHRNARVDHVMREALRSSTMLTLVGMALIIGAWLMFLAEQRRRRAAEHELQRLNIGLEEAVRHRTAELEHAMGEVARFAQHMDRTVEEERRRLAREVHDQLGQAFTALKLSVNQALRGKPDFGATLDELNALIAEGIAAARRIASELRPSILDDLGLAAALERKALQIAQPAGLDVSTRLNDTELLSAEQSTQLYRICQEALTNVVRHADARHVCIAGQACDGEYVLTVEDDGRGMPNAGMYQSLGMLSMRERAALSGGRLVVEAAPGGGVKVAVALPLAPERETDSCAS